MGHEPKPCAGAAQDTDARFAQARPAQSAERKALNLVVVGSSPTVGVFSLFAYLPQAKLQRRVGKGSSLDLAGTRPTIRVVRIELTTFRV